MSDRYERCAHNERPSQCLYCKDDEIDRLRRELAEAQDKIAELRQALAEEMSDEINVKLAEARELLRTSHTDGLHWKTWRQWRERKSALLAEKEGER
jgi:hypothetical protein